MTTETVETAAVVCEIVNPRLRGVIRSISEQFGFVSDVTDLDGTERSTNGDVYIHQSDCLVKLAVGMKIEFELVPNPKRNGQYRALKATSTPMEMVVYSSLPCNVAFLTGRQAYHAHAKTADRDLVQKAVDNHPLQNLVAMLAEQPPAEFKDTAAVNKFVESYLDESFPGLRALGVSFDLAKAGSDEERQKTDACGEMLTAMDMANQAAVQKTEYDLFCDTCEILRTYIMAGLLVPGSRMSQNELKLLLGSNKNRYWRKTDKNSDQAATLVKLLKETISYLQNNRLLGPSTILPMECLPDVFLPAPVWFIAPKLGQTNVEYKTNIFEAPPGAPIGYFANLLKNQHWADLFQIFNRRNRPLNAYRGDVIPPHILQLLNFSRTFFDWTIIATPFLDKAGDEWQDPNWERMVDPYLLAFKEGLPYFFFLGRWSGPQAGMFPLMHELTADTVAYLSKNGSKLSEYTAERYSPGGGNTRTTSARWHYAIRNGHSMNSPLGERLASFSLNLIRAFDTGVLYDYIRGTADLDPIAE